MRSSNPRLTSGGKGPGVDVADMAALSSPLEEMKSSNEVEGKTGRESGDNKNDHGTGSPTTE